MKQVYYVSEAGLNKLKEEQAHRMTVVRKHISEAIGSAKEQGDLSENFEYQDAKERQAENETRLIELNEMIARAVVVSSETGGSEIRIGTTFKTEINGTEKMFELVGATESDPMAGKISHESPIGMAFLGKAVGDEVSVAVPSGTMTYKIVSIQ